MFLGITKARKELLNVSRAAFICVVAAADTSLWWSAAGITVDDDHLNACDVESQPHTNYLCVYWQPTRYQMSRLWSACQPISSELPQLCFEEWSQIMLMYSAHAILAWQPWHGVQDRAKTVCVVHSVGAHGAIIDVTQSWNIAQLHHLRLVTTSLG